MGIEFNRNNFTITINSALGGISRGFFPQKEDEFHASIAINPYEGVGGQIPNRFLGGLIPTGYKKFSGTEIQTNPNWIIKSPKLNAGGDPFVYYYAGTKFGAFTDGAIDVGTMKTQDNAATPNSLPITVTGGAGNGAAYYNNYIYLFTGTDVARYGPLDTAGSLAMTAGVWTGATLGSQTALTNTTYPTLGAILPNHAAHLHSDNKLYFCDFLNGQGMIHYIKTKKVTNEGDTNDGSTYNALNLPFGYMPVDIESFGTDLVIIAFQTTNSNQNQGNASLFLWDTVSSSFYRQIPLPDSLATSIININGILYIFTGFISGGVRLSRFMGGYTVSTEFIFEEGQAPQAGAVEAMGESVIFPINITYPETAAALFSWGGRGDKFEPVLHCIGQCSDQGQSATVIYSIAQIVQTNQYKKPSFVLGWWRSGTTGGLDEYSNTKSVAVYRSNYFNFGRRFQINELRLNFALKVGTNNTVIPKLYFDDGDTTNIQTLATINNTNDPSAYSHTYRIDDAIGDHNFFLELRWSGTAVLPVEFPIIIKGTLLENIEPYNA